ncbi:solute carrier organic anion transporter family member 74D-like [Drosophila guanche]|uniref:Solute carrier organic anion transporter family member n=1 Tax=Drosophila guanche TaxID=7266 RepID=A0A3B0KWA9_DROGU|nr:solute carrier organic anion transporter family member 74D-like [Drosophila guanche]SPP90186.1 blast:Solute carrier organic anion transporter family member 5A1 [Drosophila guanche]
MASEETESSEFLKDKIVPEQQKDTSDTTCGFWRFKGPTLQRFASENIYMVIYGIAGCFLSIAFSYFNGTLTTLEKRYRIPTKITGVITVGNDISTVFSSAFLAYYAGRGHRPRWIGFGLVILAVFCLLMLCPQLIYGPGEDALKLTREYGESIDHTLNGTKRDEALCQKDKPSCLEDEAPSDFMPIMIFFLAQFVCGVGCSLFYTLGLSYMDDNSKKSKSPAMISWSAFLRMLGPAIGYSLASVCLRLYIDPFKEPLISKEDPRWIGAWWLGWIVLTVILLISAFFVGLFPKEMPSARARRLKAATSTGTGTGTGTGTEGESPLAERSFKDMVQTLKRLAVNKVYIYKTIGSNLYFFGYIPYWIFTPKYIEIQFKQSAAMANMATGTVALGFSAAGVLLSGYVVSKFRPSARAMAAWNCVVDYLTVAGIICYMLIGCQPSDRMNSLATLSAGDSCSLSCHCDYVHFAPVCSPTNETFISACHAGCSEKLTDDQGRTTYSGCKCISSSLSPNLTLPDENQFASDGVCPVDCYDQFLIYLAVMCLLKFVGATGRSTDLLLVLRCVPAEDKTIALGIGSMLFSVLSFIPSPIVFGWILDSYCLVWGKTCSTKGNCWLYDTSSLRYTMNLVSATLILVGSFWHIAVWYYAKDIKIFDDEELTDKARKGELMELKSKPSKNGKN